MMFDGTMGTVDPNAMLLGGFGRILLACVAFVVVMVVIGEICKKVGK